MIEALVAYFQDRGFFVEVRPGMLLIYKQIAGKQFRFTWVLPRFDLQQSYEECLFQWAEDIVMQFNHAVAEKSST